MTQRGISIRSKQKPLIHSVQDLTQGQGRELDVSAVSENVREFGGDKQLLTCVPVSVRPGNPAFAHQVAR